MPGPRWPHSPGLPSICGESGGLRQVDWLALVVGRPVALAVVRSGVLAESALPLKIRAAARARFGLSPSYRVAVGEQLLVRVV